MIETEIAYLAGIVDGEGTIQIITQTNKNKPGWPAYTTGALFVTNSNVELLDWIQQRFGGSRTKGRRVTNRNWKLVYKLQFYGEAAERVVRMIQPYLVTKQKQAALFLQLRERMRTFQHPLSADERATREGLSATCKALNARGIGQVERLSELAPATSRMVQ